MNLVIIAIVIMLVSFLLSVVHSSINVILAGLIVAILWPHNPENFVTGVIPPKKQQLVSTVLQFIEHIVAIIVSLTVLGISLYVILSGKYNDGTQKWAYGTAGSIIGFWAKKLSN
jgi:hypothetical protein